MKNQYALLSLGFGGIFFLNTALAADPVCIDYFTVGNSKCQPVASTPIAPVMGGQPPQLLAPKSPEVPKSDVDQYLDNYGKPPREFVEFYLNPTADNAKKWVNTYQQMLQKGQDLSKAWSDADQQYSASANKAASVLASPAAPPEPAPLQPTTVPLGSSASSGVSQQINNSIGAFSGGTSALSSASGVGVETPIKLTYYFSQVCPYCARTTPDLSILSKEISSKLTFTCVDVTPETAQSAPNATYITAQLPCAWRLPEPGELDNESVRQTPTLVIQKGSSNKVRLSGYVPLAQLRQYF